MTDLLISLIKIEDRDFPVYQAVDRHPSDRCDNAKPGKMRSDRIDHRSVLTDEEIARAWFTRANSLPMPIGIGTAIGPA